MSRNRSHKKTRGDRKKQSEKVQNELVSLIRNDNLISSELKNNALEKLISLNRKHRLKMPKEVSLMYCKQCKLLYDSTNTRVRVKHGQSIISCLECNDIRRIGGGPKSHRRNSDV